MLYPDQSVSPSFVQPNPTQLFVVTQSRDVDFSYDSSNKRPNELLRARELLCYFTPPPLLQPPVSIAGRLAIGLTKPLVNLDDDPRLPPAPVEDIHTQDGTIVTKDSHDPALRAFSQLLALKVNCERSMISLIDRKNQYIVAEATRTSSLINHTQQSGVVAPDMPWLGCTTILAEGGLCVNTIQLYPDAGNGTDEFSLLEIPDLTLDPRFNTRDYVLNYPHLRFYAGTPLRTKRGYNIGSICVIDSSPRVLSTEERMTLGWMATLVMQHLEMTAARGALRRNQRMVESLGRFVAGKRTLRDDSGNGPLSSPRISKVQPGTVSQGSPPETSSPEGGTGTLEEIFSRASTLVRAALMTDGVVFVDADEVYDTSSFPPREGSNGREHPGLSRRMTSGILGHSCAVGCDRKEESANPGLSKQKHVAHGKVPSDGIIQQMFDLYPLGTIISFDKQIPSANTPTAPLECNNSIDKNAFRDTLSPSEEEIFYALLEFIPNCASVLLMPLFHNGGKPYAASFSWTYDVSRVFTSDELSYMQGFMNSIMSEVSQLHTLSADKAKGDFISSISHELRSPLHGVLASTEFLAETTLDAYQRRFVDTVESCGRMLLDTINHVLDFRKLTSLVRDQNVGMVGRSLENNVALLTQQHHSSRLGKVQPLHGRVVSLVEATDLSTLTEHVIECVYAGYEFKGISSLGFTEMAASTLDASLQRSDIGLLSNRSGLSNMRGASHYARDGVTVILDFEKRDNWTFMTQPGAVRRILMNIFANALKYTDSGWVRVCLQAEDLPLDQDCDKCKSKITLTVSDSGRGIGREFLKSKLFTPFSQEDTLASGTGLGMSIVKQIVHLLGGDIDVKSQVNVGTAVTVTFILDRPPEAMNALHDTLCQAELPLVLQLREHTVGKTICLIGFDQPKSSTDCSAFALPLASLRESLTRYARQWFGMHVVTGTLSTQGVDIMLANESDDLVRCLEESPQMAPGERRPLIVLCSNVSRYRDYRPQGDHVLKFASKPCGPMKLAKALQFCFERPSKEQAHMSASTNFSYKSSQQHYPGPSSQPALATPIAETEQNTLNIPDAGFSTSSRALHAVPPASAPLITAPIVRMPAAEVVKPLGPTPNVLIVEDNPINLMLLATFIRKKHYQFTKAENGLLGVEAVKATTVNFDVILMDLNMPIMSGFEATMAIRKFEAENVGIMKRSLIIAITGLADSDDVDKAYQAGVDLFLTKPVPLKTIDRELEKWKERGAKLLSNNSAPSL